MGEPLASRADVARLFGRVAFGATKTDLDTYAGMAYEAVVDRLLNIPDPATRGPAVDDVNRITQENGTSPEGAAMWWIDRMRTTPYPLEERMTLFWHDHWATAAGEIPGIPGVMRQNQTLRIHSLGNFRTMCQALTLDGAMLQWLDGEQNVVGAPNENYAREFFELFTLGVFPQRYTETDIREAARAFTGFVVDPTTNNGRFETSRHDTGTKHILNGVVGNKGANEYKRVVDIALAQPIASRFVAYKLVQNVAYVPTSQNLLVDKDPLVEVVAAALRANSWSLKPAVRAMLLSDHFRYAPAAQGKQSVRQPAEVTVHMAKVLNVAVSQGNGASILYYTMSAAGQTLLRPPNVGGWPVGVGWLSPSTVTARYDLSVHANQLSLNSNPEPIRGLLLPPSSDVKTGGAQWAAFMGLAALSPTTAQAVKSFRTARKAVPGVTETELQSGIFLLLANSPDWQVM